MKTLQDYHNKLAAILSPAEFVDMRKRGIVASRANLLIEQLQTRKFKNILEIGRYMGYSLGIFICFSPDSVITSVDYKMQLTPILPKLLNALAIKKSVYLVHGTSDATPASKYDFVLIDADHTYAGAKKDWDNVKGKLAPGAVIVFDDVYRIGNLCNEVRAELGNKVAAYKEVPHPAGVGGVAITLKAI